MPTLRRLMADFRSPFVPDLPRFTGGAVGYLGYDASSWFEPALGDAWRQAMWANSPMARTSRASCCSTPCSRSITCSIAS